MNSGAPSRTLSVFIRRPPGDVYDYVSNPANLPQWATSFCRTVEKSGDGWIIDTPQGPVGIRFVERNDLGVLDHYVSPAPGVEIYVPMRVTPNGDGAEVLFTLYQTPDMSAERFAEDLAMVERDLETLKRVLSR